MDVPARLLRSLSRTWIWLCLVLLVGMLANPAHPEEYDFTCTELLLGQYECAEPQVNLSTQAAQGCANGEALVNCYPAPGIMCDGIVHNGSTVGFQQPIPCRNTNGYSYRTTLLLSIFLGMFGIDRLYLGYLALGLLKFCTMGLLFVGHFVDVILIATQVVGPADGSAYVMDFYSPRLVKMTINNETYFVPQDIIT
ncbi:TM2 domain-containing protein 1-like [Diadema antillarum]|uniref:TM2 domain-containing protein 1-like n=1 Tax=Diadema antillarum TaxID=105358 RepID=UPI003A89F6AA